MLTSKIISAFICLLLLFSGDIFSQETLFAVTYRLGVTADFDESQLLQQIPDKLLGMSDELLNVYTADKYFTLQISNSASYYSMDKSKMAEFSSKFNDSGIRAELDTLSTTYFSFKEREIITNKSKNDRTNAWRISQSGFSHAFVPNGETISILGYTCIGGTIDFCGHKTTIYYTPEIPYPSGPEKFLGLPGLILKTVDSKGVRGYTAVKLDVYDKTCSSKTPMIQRSHMFNVLPNAREISYEQYCSEEKKN